MAKTKAWGIVGLIMGISSIVFAFIFSFFGIILGILVIIFSVKQKRVAPNGVATGGLVTSIIGLIFSVLFILI